jgi:hypothetical protein
MKQILMYFKETDNKMRWDADCDGTLFELYIPKWRIPSNIPKTIKVSFDSIANCQDRSLLTPSKVRKNPNLLELPIFAEVHFHSLHTKTIRFDPSVNNNPEIGSPYIPFSLIAPELIGSKIVIKVEWKF